MTATSANGTLRFSNSETNPARDLRTQINLDDRMGGLLIMNCCACPQTKDLTQGLGAWRHIFCTKCKSHLFKGRQYSAQEWERWINLPYADYLDIPNFNHGIQKELAI